MHEKNLRCSYRWYYKWCAKYDIPVKRNCDEEIVEWILTSYDLNLNVSHEDVQKKALEIYRECNEGDFKVSSDLFLKFASTLQLLLCYHKLWTIFLSNYYASIRSLLLGAPFRYVFFLYRWRYLCFLSTL